MIMKRLRKLFLMNMAILLNPQKHFESLITKFIEAWWLPKRFGYDVRNHQLSSLVITGQMTREQALERLSQPSVTKAEEREMFKQVADFFTYIRV